MNIQPVHGRVCGSDGCPTPPVWFLRCKGCRSPGLLCDEHWEEALKGANWGADWKCITCGAQAKKLSDLLDAMQLVDK